MNELIEINKNEEMNESSPSKIAQKNIGRFDNNLQNLLCNSINLRSDLKFGLFGNSKQINYNDNSFSSFIQGADYFNKNKQTTNN